MHYITDNKILNMDTAELDKQKLIDEFIGIAEEVTDRHIMKAALEVGMTYSAVKRRLTGKLGHYPVMEKALLDNLKNQIQLDNLKK